MVVVVVFEEGFVFGGGLGLEFGGKLGFGDGEGVEGIDL